MTIDTLWCIIFYWCNSFVLLHCLLDCRFHVQYISLKVPENSAIMARKKTIKFRRLKWHESVYNVSKKTQLFHMTSFYKWWPISIMFGTHYTKLMCNITVIYFTTSPTVATLLWEISQAHKDHNDACKLKTLGLLLYSQQVVPGLTKMRLVHPRVTLPCQTFRANVSH